MKTVKAVINDLPVEVPEGTSVLEAARTAEVTIPTLCRHKDLLPTASCGICVVRQKGSPRLFRSCATPLEDGMNIVTMDPEIVSVRKNILELILSNHPNDCLQCGRNGTCELQDLTAVFGIRQIRHPVVIPDTPRDYSTRAISLDTAKCIRCGRCLEACQRMQDVWALSFLERGIHTRMAPAGDIALSESPCVRCGQCSAHCPTGAIFEYDETAQVWDALMNPDIYCVAQIAPSVRVALGEAFGLPPGTNLTKKIYAMLRRMGFRAVFDTNFGADVTIMEEASEFAERFTRHPEKLPLITTCCPSWVDFMEKKHHDMIPHFSSCKSPHAILGVLTKTYWAEAQGMDPSAIYMVSIMPCTSKKYEIQRSEEMFASGGKDIDVSITTREFARMIKQAGIDFLRLPDQEADSLLGDYSGGGVIFGATGGVMEAALRTAAHTLTGENLPQVDIREVRGLAGVKEADIAVGGKTVRVAVAHGLANVEQVLSRVRDAKREGAETPYHFIEVMACPGGCIGGGGQPYGIDDDIRRERARGLYEDDASPGRPRCSHENPFVQKLYADFLGEPGSEKAHGLLHTGYVPRQEYQR